MNTAKAKSEYARLKKSLTRWLAAKERLQNVAKGVIPGNRAYADSALREPSPTEDELGRKLGQLINELYPGEAVPNNAVGRAETLLSLERKAQFQSFGQQAPGFVPILIGAVALVLILGNITSTLADKARHEADLEYYKATGTHPPGPWYTNIGILALVGVGGWFLWSKTTVLSKFKAGK